MHARFVQPIRQWWIEHSGLNEELTFIVMIMAWMSNKQSWFGRLTYSNMLIKQTGSNNSGFSGKKSSMNDDWTSLSMCTSECWLNLWMNGNFFNIQSCVQLSTFFGEGRVHCEPIHIAHMGYLNAKSWTAWIGLDRAMWFCGSYPGQTNDQEPGR